MSSPPVDAAPPGKRALRVAIIGRPNVGKSTLFNALLGVRRAITHQSPGVTRDTVEAEWRLTDRSAVLVDTGGYSVEAHGLARVVAERSLREARLADVVLLVVDVTETTGDDERLVERLRSLAHRIVLVVNKVDTSDRDPQVWNWLSRGFPNVVGVSAAHRRGLDALTETVRALAVQSPALGIEDRTSHAEPAIRIAIVGKPNTGKSSLANRLLGRERSIVHDQPGTTRDVVEDSFRYRGVTFRILDTAGIRRRTHVRDPVEYYSVSRATESVRECDVVFLLADSREELSDQDKKIAGLAVAEGKGIIIVLNKADLLPKRPRLLDELKERVRFRFPVLGFAPVIATSAKTGEGVGRLAATALELAGELGRRVGTGRLNQALERWMNRYPLPARGRNYHIHYLVQVGVNPLRFVAFVNRLAGFPVAYTQYLANCIRREFGLADVPVSVTLRQSSRPLAQANRRSAKERERHDGARPPSPRDFRSAKRRGRTRQSPRARAAAARGRPRRS